MPVKVYIASNLAGKYRGMVAAQNLKEAARLFETSIYDLRTMGYHLAANPLDIQLAMSNPGTVYLQLIWPINDHWTRKDDL